MRLRRLIHRSARPLDYTKWKFLFENGSCDDFLLVLSGYQNEDGGFGYNIECNNWNPNSSPYTVCIALDYLDTTGDYDSSIKSRIISDIVKYLNSGAYLLDDGWVGMQGIPVIMTSRICRGFILIPEKQQKPISELLSASRISYSNTQTSKATSTVKLRL